MQTGQPGWFPVREVALSDGHWMSVNLANGNLMLMAEDVTAGEPTYDVRLQRTYNSRATDDVGLGRGWLFDSAPQVRLEVASATVRAFLPDAAVLGFHRQTDGSFETVDGAGWTLSATSGGFLADKIRSGDSLRFDGGGNLVATVDELGREFTVAATSGNGRTLLGSKGTSSGRRINFSYDGAPRTREADDPNSGHHYYRYDSGGRLDTYELGSTTARYTYDAANRLTGLSLPSGVSAAVAYNTAGRVTSVTVSRDGSTVDTFSIVYESTSAPCLPSDIAKVTVTDNGVVDDPLCITADGHASNRTPPPAPTGLDVERDSQSRVAYVTWADDDESGYGMRMRYRRPGGAWSDYQTENFEVPDTTAGETLEIESQRIGEDGAVSAAANDTVTVPEGTAWTQAELEQLDATTLTEDQVNAQLDAPYDPNGIDAEDPSDGTGSGAARAAAPRTATTRSGTACAAAAGDGCAIPPRPFPDRGDGSDERRKHQPRARTGRKKRDLDCSKNGSRNSRFTRFRNRMRKGSRRARDCDDSHWTEVYRFESANGRDVVYVGVGADHSVRCTARARVLRLPVKQCKHIMTVPSRPVATAVESYLIEVYGLRAGNENYDTRFPFRRGTFNGRSPSLTNKVRSFAAKRAGARPLYCAAMEVGAFTVNVYRPNYIEAYPPGAKFFWPNFAARDCLAGGNYSLLENYYRGVEGKPPASPRP